MGNLALHSAEEPDNLRATTGTVEVPTERDNDAALVLGARPIIQHQPAARHSSVMIADPLWSCVMLLCGPLRFFVVFSHTHPRAYLRNYASSLHRVFVHLIHSRTRSTSRGVANSTCCTSEFVDDVMFILHRWSGRDVIKRRIFIATRQGQQDLTLQRTLQCMQEAAHQTGAGSTIK